MMVEACASIGSLELFDAIYNRIETVYKRISRPISKAIERQDYPFALMFLERGFEPDNDEIVSLLVNTDKTIDFFADIGQARMEIICAKLAHAGAVETFKSIARRIPLSHEIAEAAAGNLELVKYVHQRDAQWLNTMCDICTDSNCLEYLVDHGAILSENVCPNFVEKGTLEGLKYARSRGAPWGSFFSNCFVFSLSRSAEMVQYFLEQPEIGYIDKEDTLFTSKAGCLEVLALLRSNGFAWNSNVIYQAIKRDDLVTLTYAHEMGCSFGTCNLIKLSKRHSLKCRAYLRSVGYVVNILVQDEYL